MASASDTSNHARPGPAWRYEPLVLLAAALATGIAADRFSPLPITGWWLLASFSLTAWLVCRCWTWDAVGSLLVLLATACLGAAWHHERWHLVDENHVVTQIREEPQPIALEARVLSSPRIVPAPPPTPLRSIPTGDRSRCEVDIVRVREHGHWRSATGRARLTVDGHLLDVQAGDVVRAFALYQRPTPALNPGEFDFAEFERSERRWCSLTTALPECVQVVQKGSTWSPRRWLDEVRRAGDFQLRRHIAPTQAGLASAVLLGQREYLDADRNERFLVTGTVHLLAISGLNLAILVSVFWLLGRTGILSRRGTLAAAIAFALSYALLTDAEPPVLRAAVLITAFCVARWSGRPTSPWQVLAASALVVLVLNPAALFHVGAQLSFLAVGVLAWFHPYFVIRSPADPLDRLIAQTRPWPMRAARQGAAMVWQAFASGAMVWLLTVPLVWYRYQLVSPVALPLNPLVALPMSLALFSGFAVLVLSWLVPSVGEIAGTLCALALELMEQTIAWCEPWIAGYFWLPAPPGWWVGMFYLVVAIVAVVPQVRPRRAWFATLMTVWLAMALYLAMPLPRSHVEPNRPLAVTFASVGHGAAVLVELPDGRNLLYDCGRLGSPLSGARPIAAVLWSRGITHLDAVVVSHADADHYNALPKTLERFSVGVVYVSSVMWDGTSPGPHLLRQSIGRLGVPIVMLKAGDRLRTEEADTTLEVLHPPRGGVFGTDNANSIVLLIECAGRCVLLTGDLEARGLNDLLAEPAIDVDVLMVPHHGSRRSNSQGLAQWCRPEHVVISGARDFELGRDPEEVGRTYYAAGSNVYHTAEHGAVRFELTAAEVRVVPHREPPVRSGDSVYFVATKASQ